MIDIAKEREPYFHIDYYTIGNLQPEPVCQTDVSLNIPSLSSAHRRLLYFSKKSLKAQC